ncbi:acetyl-CoA carboxylase biotin carboxyl carrier protein [bacterium]|nr:acetyl-CoA carboxylase biotin carboxyl carrier protein [candidate division CSSED10-310 bacterium]
MNLQKIRQLARLLHKEDIQELELQDGDQYLRLKRNGQPAPGDTGITTETAPIQPASQEEAPAISDSSEVVLSPLAGTFYRSKAPGAPPLVNIGDEVRKGKTLCILEAMKLMNELEAPEDGRIIEILAENAQSVQEGQPLFKYIPL